MTNKPKLGEPVLAEISATNSLSTAHYYEVIYHDGDRWCAYFGSKTFQDGEIVLRWIYAAEAMKIFGANNRPTVGIRKDQEMDEKQQNQIKDLQAEFAKQQMIREREKCLALEGKEALGRALHILRSNKPEERGELARRYAVTITEMEKVYAYFVIYVLGEIPISHE